MFLQSLTTVCTALWRPPVSGINNCGAMIFKSKKKIFICLQGQGHRAEGVPGPAVQRDAEGGQKGPIGKAFGILKVVASLAGAPEDTEMER